jgi:hypothetical protein
MTKGLRCLAGRGRELEGTGIGPFPPDTQPHGLGSPDADLLARRLVRAGVEKIEEVSHG